MNMLRALIAFVILFLAGRLLGRLLRSASPPGRANPDVPVTHMVRCARCGTFIPSGEALVDGDRQFCSTEHRRLGPAGKP